MVMPRSTLQMVASFPTRTLHLSERIGTGNVTVDGVGSTWNDNIQIDIGGGGSGTLTISNGGHVSSFGSTVGRNPGSNGVVNVSGAGSSWTNNGFLAA